MLIVSQALLASLVLMTALAACIAKPPEPDGPSASVASQAPAVPSRSAAPTTVLATPTDDGATEVPPSQAGPTAEPIDGAACLLGRQPGPADVAPTEGDLMDWSHVFGGRARLCLGGTEAHEFEGTAWCTWADRLDAVREIALLPRPVDAATGQIEGGVSLERRVAYIGGTSPEGVVSSWEGGPLGQEIRSHDAGRRGIVRFDVSPVVDPEHPPSIVAPNLVGLLRWVCLEPPAR